MKPKKKQFRKEVFDLYDRLFELDRQNPWFGQTVEPLTEDEKRAPEPPPEKKAR